MSIPLVARSWWWQIIRDTWVFGAGALLGAKLQGAALPWAVVLWPFWGPIVLAIIAVCWIRRWGPR